MYTRLFSPQEKSLDTILWISGTDFVDIWNHWRLLEITRDYWRLLNILGDNGG